MSNLATCTHMDSRTGRYAFTQYEQLTPEEERQACEAFILLDTDGDGEIDLPVIESILISLGRLPLDEEIIDILFFADEDAEDTVMNLQGFQWYLRKQLNDTTNEENLRNAFKVFDSDPPTGKVSLPELREYLKKTGMKLTDDEIDHLFREEDYWMLEEKNLFQYEELINKILNKPTCHSRFLNCWQ